MSWLSFLQLFTSDFDLYRHQDNPLPDCPSSPNCARTTFKINSDSETVFKLCKTILQAIGADDIKPNDDHKKITSVFKVFTFKDDFVLQLQEKKNHTTLVHIRSASRTGYSDLGVNKRRVKRFYNALNRAFNQ